MRYTTSLHLAVWNALVLGLIGIGWVYGLVDPIFREDRSHLTVLIATVAAFFMVFSQIQARRLDEMKDATVYKTDAATSLLHLFSDKVFVIMGIVATVMGIVMFASMKAVDGTHASADDIAALITAGNATLSTGFNGSLCGLLATLWGTIALYFLEVRVRELHAEVHA